MRFFWKQENGTGNKRRSFFTVGAFLLAFFVLLCNLVDLQLINGSVYAAQTDVKRTRTLAVNGARGKILDTNGIPMAQDEVCYNLEFYREYNLISEREMYTKSILFCLELMHQYGRDITASFAIAKNSDGEYYFEWGNVSAETAAARESTWRSDFYFADSKGLKMNCEQMYAKMRERYKIPEDLDDETAFRVLGIWQDSIQSYWSSKSITILKNIDYSLMSAIQSYSYELAGFQVSQSSIRVYPQGDTACHIVGYLGRITAENLKYYKDLGYDNDSLVGVSGIENYMEAYLTGASKERSGSRTLEVTNSGRILSELEYVKPSAGDNVYLTVDINLQRISEQALANNIKYINETQQQKYASNKAYYDKIVEARGGKPISFAKVGAAVVMDCNTGAVRALASQPSYNPNLFSQGISKEDYEAILSDEGKPLFNKAISSSDTPGSIFKLCVAVAGLMENGIRVDEEIRDEGEFKKYVSGTTKGPMCGWYRDHSVTHGSINVVKAINYSCNYFFYEVADRIGIENIKKWARNFGLLSKTNIELTGEAVGLVGDQETLYDSSRDVKNQDTSLPYLVYRAIRSQVLECAKVSERTLTEEELNSIISACFELVGESRKDAVSRIRHILVDEYNLSKAKVDSETKFEIYSYITQITWTPTNTIQSGIGQSITTVTPIAVARYISAIVNGGNVYDAHIVKKVTGSSGQLVYQSEPTLFNKLDVKEEYLEAVKQGMKEMISAYEDSFSSTARKYFQNYKYRDEMGGKTGTAQVSTINLEDNAWFVAFAPYENPEIVVVTYIPNGYSGSMASETVKAIVEYYLDNKYAVENDDVPNMNSVLY